MTREQIEERNAQIHKEWQADVMALEPGGNWDYLLHALPRMQQIDADPLIHFTLFVPGTGFRWYALGGYQLTDGNWILRTYATGPDSYYDEYGDVALKDLLDTIGPYGASVERDRYFAPCRMSEIKTRKE